MPREIIVAWSSTLVCAWLSQQWSGAFLSYTLENGMLYLLGFLITVLATLMASVEFTQ